MISGVLRLCKNLTFFFFRAISALIIVSFVIGWLVLVVAGHIFTPFIPVISPEPVLSGYLGFYSGIISLGIIPLVILITLLFKVLWGYRVKRSVKRGIAGLWFVTFLVFVSTVIFTAKNFSHDYAETEIVYEKTLTDQKELNLDFSNSYRKMQKNRPLSMNFENVYLGKNELIIRDVRLKILPSNSDNLKVVKTSRSTGSSRTNALVNMTYPIHELSVEDNTLRFADYYHLKKKDKYRAQRLQYVVHVPIGTQLHFSGNNRLLRSSDFVDHIRDKTQQDWIMSEEGIRLIENSGK